MEQGKVNYTYLLENKRERKTIYNWLKLYISTQCINAYLNIKSRGSHREEISERVKQGLSKQLSDPSITINWLSGVIGFGRRTLLGNFTI